MDGPVSCHIYGVVFPSIFGELILAIICEAAMRWGTPSMGFYRTLPFFNETHNNHGI